MPLPEGGGNRKYSIEYERRCFDAWYLNGRPNKPSATMELLPEDENGKKPSPQTLKNWMMDSWFFRADELDAQVEQKADISLVEQKVKMLKRHQKQAADVEAKALAHILSDGFDSSASAVQALFRGMEEERKTAGFSDLLEKLESMTNNQVRDQIINLINRATENNQIVEEADAVVTGEEDIPIDIEE